MNITIKRFLRVSFIVLLSSFCLGAMAQKTITPPKPPTPNPTHRSTPTPPSLSVDDYYLSFTASTSTSQWVKVTTNVKQGFRIDGVSDEYGNRCNWCHAEQSGYNQIRIYCDNNNNTNPRTAKIKISAKGAQNQYINVTQAGKDYYLRIDKDYNNQIRLTAEDNRKEIPISTNDIISYCEVIESYPNGWATVTKESNKCILNCGSNSSGKERWATIRITPNHTGSQEVKIIQPPLPPKAVLSNIKVKHNVNIGNEKGMRISFNLDIKNTNNLTGQALAWFYDENDKSIKAPSTANGYKDKAGNLVCYTDISQTDNNITLSVPYKYLISDRNHEKKIKYDIVIRDKENNQIGRTNELQETIPIELKLQVLLNNREVNNCCFEYNEEETKNYILKTNDTILNVKKTDENLTWFTVNKTPSGFDVTCEKNKTKETRSGTVIIETKKMPATTFSINQYAKPEKEHVHVRARFSLGFDLAASANYNMKNIGSKENSELFYSWGGGMLFRTTIQFGHHYNYYDRINLSVGARYMKYSYNYLTTKGDLGNYIVFPINLKFNVNRSDRCQFYLGAGYEYGMGLKDAPNFMDWNAGIGICGRVVDWYIFYKQHFNTEDEGKFYFSDHYKNHIGTSITFYINL